MNDTRRSFLGALGLCGLALPLPRFAFAQASVLPLNTPGMDHLDVIVPDVAATAKFYMGVFNTALHVQPFQGGFRYFVLLGELNERREVGYIAVGDARGRGTYIGHFCTSVNNWRNDSQAIFRDMTQAFAAAGFGAFPGSTGVGGIFADPDGIEIQFLPAPDTLVTAAEPADLVPWHEGLVKPRRLDHVLLRVSDLERAVQYYEILYGPPTRRDVGDRGRVYFDFPASNTSLQLEQAHYVYGEAAKIEHFCIQTEAFDRGRVSEGLAALGATVLAAPDEPEVLRFRDPDGNLCELKAL
jgi:catechol 2,3-dioxygenase-like lactoylglutathione lyase family enzyme